MYFRSDPEVEGECILNYFAKRFVNFLVVRTYIAAIWLVIGNKSNNKITDSACLSRQSALYDLKPIFGNSGKEKRDFMFTKLTTVLWSNSSCLLKKEGKNTLQ